MAFDLAIFNFLHQLAGRFFLLDWLFIFFASYLQYFLVVVLIYFIFSRSKDWRAAWYRIGMGVLAVILARGILTEAIRFFYSRPRPFLVLQFSPLIRESSGSFPSGHAAFFFALAPLAFLVSKKSGYWFTAGSLLMLISRIIVGVHWPADILAGMIIGLFSFWFVRFLLPAFKYHPADEATH